MSCLKQDISINLYKTQRTLWKKGWKDYKSQKLKIIAVKIILREIQSLQSWTLNNYQWLYWATITMGKNGGLEPQPLPLNYFLRIDLGIRHGRLERRLGGEQHHRLFFQRTRVQLPTLTWQCKTVCNSRFRGSNTFTQSHMQAKHQCT